MIDVIFGDVHGNADLLGRLMERARSEYGECQFHTLGDLIDRGPDSKGVVDLCVANNVKGIFGNHEIWFRQALHGGSVFQGVTSALMGGMATLQSYGVPFTSDEETGEALRAAVPHAHKDWLSSLTPFAVVPTAKTNLYLVHAGVNAGFMKTFHFRLGGILPDDVTLLRWVAQHASSEMFWSTPDIWGHEDGLWTFANGVQVIGHRPVSKPVFRRNFIAVDTGCGTCKPFSLSAICVMPDGRLKGITVP